MKQDIVIIIVILLNIENRVLGQSATFTVPDGLKGSSCRLTCTVKPASAITFRLNGVSQGSCPFANDPSTCDSANHNISQIGDSTYLDIKSLDYSRDDGTWRCENNVQIKEDYLIVYSPMQDISISFSKTESLSEGETVTVTAEMKCQYTNSSFTKFSLYKKEKKQNIAQEINSTTSFYSYNSSSDGCQSHEQNIVATFSVSSSQACGETQMYAVFNHSYLGSKTGSLSSALNFPGCQLSTVLSSTVQPSTPEPSPSFQPCLISNSLLLWHCIVIWIVIGVAVIILVGCCIFYIWKKRQNSEKKQSTENNEMQDLKDEKRNNKAFDDKTENKDRTDMKSVDKSEKKQSTENNKMQNLKDKKRNNKGFDNKTENKDRTDTKSIDKSGNSGYDKSGYDNNQFYRGNHM